MCELTGQLAACKVCTAENKKLRKEIKRLRESLARAAMHCARPAGVCFPSLAEQFDGSEDAFEESRDYYLDRGAPELFDGTTDGINKSVGDQFDGSATPGPTTATEQQFDG